MKNSYVTNSLVILVGMLSVLLGSCEPEETASSTANNSATTEVITPTEQPETASLTKDKSSAPKPKETPATNVQSQDFEITNYSNEDWAIAVVDSGNTSTSNLTYYACDQGQMNCLQLTAGTMKCVGDVCTYDWLNGDFRYSLVVSEYSKLLQVYEGNELKLESAELVQDYYQFYGDEVDLIPNGGEEVAGISEQQLKALLPKIQKAVFTENWQALADLSVDSVNFGFPDTEGTTKVANSELVTTIAQQNLDDWKIRVMTQTFDDLFLNQYGAMIGQGSIWIGSKEVDQPAQIITFNIW